MEVSIRVELCDAGNNDSLNSSPPKIQPKLHPPTTLTLNPERCTEWVGTGSVDRGMGLPSFGTRRGRRARNPLSLSRLSQPHPGGNPGANLKPISHRCHPVLVAFVWELTEPSISLGLPPEWLNPGRCAVRLQEVSIGVWDCRIAKPFQPWILNAAPYGICLWPFDVPRGEGCLL